jgi:hypothetical protein
MFDPAPDIFLEARGQLRGHARLAQERSEFCVVGIEIRFVHKNQWRRTFPSAAA